MNITDFKLGHAEQLGKIHSEDFPLPDFGNRRIFARRVIEKDGKLIAASWLKVTSEASLVFDKRVPRLTRAKALEMLIEVMMFELDKAGLEDTHVFLQGSEIDRTANFLRKFNFVEVPEKCLYLPPRKEQSHGQTA